MQHFVPLLICRFIQALGLLALWIGVTLLDPLAEDLRALVAGNPWTWGNLATHFLCVSGPIYLGLAAILGMGAVAGILKTADRRERQFPDQPWMQRPEWAAQHIRLTNRLPIRIAIIAGSFYLLILIPLAGVIATQKNSSAITYVVGGIGLFLLLFARLGWKNRQWSRSELTFETLPGVIGGPFAGVVLLKEHFPEGTPFRVTLLCEVTTGGGRNTSSQTTVLWQSQKIIDRFLNAGPSAIGIPVHFAIPYDCEPTSLRFTNVRFGNRTQFRNIRWSITVTLKDADVRSVQFEIPVFKTPASSPTYRDDDTPLAPFLEKPNAELVVKRLSIRRETTAQGVRLRISTFEWPAFLFLLGMGLICAAGTAALFHYLQTWPPFLFAALFPALFLALAVAGIIDMLAWSSAILIHSDQVEIHSGHVWSRRHAAFPRTAVTLDTAEDFKKQTGGAWWTLRACPPNAAPFKILRRLDGKQEADAVCVWLREQIAEIEHPKN